MAQLNFPNTRLDGSPIQAGDQYTGDNGVTYIFDGVKWVGHAVAQPAGTNSITNNGNTVQVDIDGNLVIPNNATIKYANGDPVVTGGGSTATIWTNNANGCLRAELSSTGFQAFTDATHLDLQDGGIWNVGSYQNSTFIGNDDFDNTNVLSLRSGDATYITTNLRENGNYQWAFGTDGSLAFPVLSSNARTGSGDNLQFAKGAASQKIISTQNADADITTVERLVVAGGDSYYDSNAHEWFGEGGDIYLWAGKGANGGDIKVDAGNALGLNGDEGGTIKIRGGSSDTGNGGFLELSSGNGAQNGGTISITSGYGQNTGGDISITAQFGGETNGKITLQAGSNPWTFNPDGTFKTPIDSGAGSYNLDASQSTNILSTVTPTVVFTALDTRTYSVKATISIIFGTPDTLETQTCEMLIVRKTAGFSSPPTTYTAIATVYGVIHTTTDPLATFDVKCDVDGRIQITALQAAGMDGPGYFVQVVAKEMLNYN